MQWLNYHHLYYFWMIANEGGVAKASQKLRLGQPTLSTQLKQLEDAFGKPLFERKNRKLVLTESGKIALRYANDIFRMGQELSEVMNDQSVGSRSHVAIGALDSVPKDLILSLTLESRKFSDCFVSVLEGKGDELFRELASHRLDLIVSNYPPPANDQFRSYSRSVSKIPVAVYGSKEFVHLKKGFPRSLNAQPFVLPTAHSKLRSDLEHFARVNQLNFIPVAETQDTSLQKLMGIRGVGLVPLPELSSRESQKVGQLVQIGRLEGVSEEIWLITADRKVENPIAAHLMKTFTVEGQ